MKVPIWTEISESDLLSKSVLELGEIFFNEDIIKQFYEQDDVSLELLKKVIVVPISHKEKKFFKLIQLPTPVLKTIRLDRFCDDCIDDAIVSILKDRNEYETCDICEYLKCRCYQCEMNKRFYCKYYSSIEQPESFKCEHWEKANSRPC